MKRSEEPSWKWNNVYAVIMMLAVFIPLLGGIFYRQGITDEKIDMLTADVEQILQSQNINLQAMNRLESHVCTLDTKQGIQCISNQ